jgi:hypothetical protein
MFIVDWIVCLAIGYAIGRCRGPLNRIVRWLP